MHRFLHDDFLLTSSVARDLYHGVAAVTPIVDVHNHLSPADIADDRVWTTLTELWLDDDHYKWKAMRLAGVAEELVTGDADPWDKFVAWAATVQRSLGNPLYTWTHLELRRVFGIDIALNPATAREIYDEANRQLPGWSARCLLEHFKVTVVATTDDPTDDLSSHVQHRSAAGSARTTLIPTFRPDAAHRLLDDVASWNGWADHLAARSGITVTDLASLLDALRHSYARFTLMGGRASDHGLACVPDRARDPDLADSAVKAARNGRPATDSEREVVLLEVVALAARLAVTDDSVLQLHLGPLRNVSPRLLDRVGRDAGADVMGDERHALGLARLLGDLESRNELPRTVLYNLNPADNALFATMSGAFSRPGVESLVQWGPPWWFNDHEAGMRRQLEDLGHIGQMAGFIGMLTDSRSILSMTRHELFRRILCDVIAREVTDGRYPGDMEYLAVLTKDVCIDNAVRYFGFPESSARWP